MLSHDSIYYRNQQQNQSQNQSQNQPKNQQQNQQQQQLMSQQIIINSQIPNTNQLAPTITLEFWTTWESVETAKIKFLETISKKLDRMNNPTWRDIFCSKIIFIVDVFIFYLIVFFFINFIL